MFPNSRDPRSLDSLVALVSRLVEGADPPPQSPVSSRLGGVHLPSPPSDPLPHERLVFVEDRHCDLMAVARRPDGTVVVFFDPRELDRVVDWIPGLLQHQLAHVTRGHLDDPRLRTTRYPEELRIAQELEANEDVDQPLPPDAYRVEQFAPLGIRPGQTLERRFRILVEATRTGRLWPGLAIRRSCGCGDGTGPGPVTAQRAFHGAAPARLEALPPTIPPVRYRHRLVRRRTGIGRSATRRRRRRS